MLVTTDDYFATYDATPMDGDPTPHPPGRGRTEADAEGLVESIRSFMSEDVEACERMQIGASSPHFSIGATAAPMRNPSFVFTVLATMDDRMIRPAIEHAT